MGLETPCSSMLKKGTSKAGRLERLKIPTKPHGRTIDSHVIVNQNRSSSKWDFAKDVIIIRFARLNMATQ